MISRALDYLRDLARRREFALALGTGNLKARNANTGLGILWWVLNPLLLGAVYYLVFGVIFPGRRPDNFLVYLLSGMFVFHFTSQSMTGGANSIISNAKLLANLRFPRLILPISALIEAASGFLVSLGLLVSIAVITGQASITHRILYLPVVIGVHLLFNLGLGAMTARLAVPFRDINNLIPYINRIWLYLSPIIWPLSFLDDAEPWVRTAIRLNPMYDFIGLYRSALLGSPIIADHVIGAVAAALVVGFLGIGLFVKYEGHMVRYL
ncbi:MAG: ABC transporter permease [Acidimicrobiia bacterium]|nr:ABC transporter permease [Acidimicrobiia bacterium]MDH4307715.1 ABC transporter permease [Acidimicrobiia bacterium]